MASALVTGGSSGIGLAIGRMLREEGFAVTLASRAAEKVEAAAAELGAHRSPPTFPTLTTAPAWSRSTSSGKAASIPQVVIERVGSSGTIA